MRRVFLILLAAACTETEKPPIGDAKERDNCSAISDCQAGLTCNDGKCSVIEAPPGPFRGDTCQSDSDCAPDLVCGTQEVCSDFAGADAGQPCGLRENCKPPLICNGVTGVCANDDTTPGTYDLDEDCVEPVDCQRPFLCAKNFGSLDSAGVCAQPPLFLGPDCSRSEDERGAFRVYYELSQPPDAIEFYRLPFPNDLRRTETGVSMTGHPAPGDIFGFDIVGAFLEVAAHDIDGFGLNQPILFQLTDPPIHESMCLDAGGVYPDVAPPDPEKPDDPLTQPYCPSGGAPSVFLVDLATNDHIPVQLGFGPDRGQFICQNWLGIVPLAGRPLKPGTTYAAVITTGIRNIREGAPIQDRDFIGIASGSADLPADVRDKTQPLRDWMQRQNIAPETIAAATVFTTANPAAMGKALRDAVQALPAPQFNGDEQACPGIQRMCEGDAVLTVDRQCGSDSRFTEVHGTYSGPAFQAGTRPYLVPGQGGEIAVSGGVPQKAADETMCYALAVPTGRTMPTGGWPVLIYAHGTGGNYRSFADDGAFLDHFLSLGFAIISFDNVMHGPRKGTDWLTPLGLAKDPGELFFNMVNPRASRDNVLQGAADLFYLTRLLRSDSLNTTTTGAINFDPGKVFYFGHSQGTVIAPPFLAYESDVQAFVISGAGAELPLSILNKTSPNDVSVAASVFFGDTKLGRIHPMMGIMSMIFAEADAVSYARFAVAEPIAGRTARPLLMVSGVDDTFTPDVTHQALMRALGIPLVGGPEPGTEIPDVPVAGATVQNNVNGVTAGAIHYANTTGGDGHFVVYDTPAAGQAMQDFLSSVLSGTPRIHR